MTEMDNDGATPMHFSAARGKNVLTITLIGAGLTYTFIQVMSTFFGGCFVVAVVQGQMTLVVHHCTTLQNMDNWRLAMLIIDMSVTYLA